MLLKVNDNGTLRQFDIAQKSDVSAKMPNVTFGTKTTLVDTTTLSFSKDGDNDWYCTAENPIQGFTKTDFLYDAVYKITWDGVEYDELFVQEHEIAQISTDTQRVTIWYDWRCIGNASILGYHNYYETNAPFCVAYDFHRNESEIQIFTLSTEASHTIKIERISYTKKLTPIQYYTDTIRGRSPVAWGSGQYSVVEGKGSVASAEGSHSEGCATIASGYASHSEGESSIASGNYGSHAEGYFTQATGRYGSHAEGQLNIASGNFGSHAEGFQTKAAGMASHSEGYVTIANGFVSHAEGFQTVANNRSQHVFGENNIIDTTQDTTARGAYVEIVGNGTADNTRSNARTLDWSGNEVLAGKLTVGTAPTNNMDVATKQYVDNAIPTVPVTDVQINSTSIVSNGVADVPKASSSTLGVVRGGLTGVGINNDGQIFLSTASEGFIKSGTNSDAPIAPNNQHISAFYGLTKAAGVDMASSDNAVGTYTSAAKTAIRTMLGAIGNADYATQSTGGVVKIIDNGSGGFQIDQGYLLILPASSNQIKTGSATTLSPIVPNLQHESTFYGLAKAAGDSTQSASNNAVGTYTSEAKAAIKTMIGVPTMAEIITAVHASYAPAEEVTF